MKNDAVKEDIKIKNFLKTLLLLQMRHEMHILIKKPCNYNLF